MLRILLLIATIIPRIAHSQAGTEILLFDLKENANGTYTISHGKNITKHKGYDNQPSFHPVKPEIYFASAMDSTNVDIRIFNFKTGKTTQFTSTPENEFSPAITPDRKFVSCVIQRKNGAQDLGKYPIGGGEPSIIVNDMKVGYYAWADSIQLMMFVLADTGNRLYYYHTVAKHKTLVGQNIKRSLHKIPKENAISYVEKAGDSFMIRRLPLDKEAVFDIAVFPGKDDYCWAGDGTLFSWRGNKLVSLRPGKDQQWHEVIILGDVAMIKNGTRLAINATSNKLAMVVSE